MSDPRAARQARERQTRVTAILDTALELAVAGGIESVTTTRLAERLGYTVGALYRYWPSIDGLLAALHQHTAELFYRSFFEAFGPLRARLRGEPNVVALAEVLLLPSLYARVAAAHPRHFEFVAQLVTRRWRFIDGNALLEASAVALPRIAEVVGIMRGAATARALRPGDAVVRTMTLWVSVHAALALGPLAERHPQLLDPSAIAREATHALLLGWGAAQRTLAAAERTVARALTRPR